MATTTASRRRRQKSSCQRNASEGNGALQPQTATAPPDAPSEHSFEVGDSVEVVKGASKGLRSTVMKINSALTHSIELEPGKGRFKPSFLKKVQGNEKHSFAAGDWVRITAVQRHQSKSWIGKTGIVARVGKDRVRVKVLGKGDVPIDLPLPPECLEFIGEDAIAVEEKAASSDNLSKPRTFSRYQVGDRVCLHELPPPEAIVFHKQQLEVGDRVTVLCGSDLRYHGKEGTIEDIEENTFLVCVGDSSNYFGEVNLDPIPQPLVEPLNMVSVFTVEAISGDRCHLSYEGSEPFPWYVDVITGHAPDPVLPEQDHVSPSATHPAIDQPAADDRRLDESDRIQVFADADALEPDNSAGVNHSNLSGLSAELQITPSEVVDVAETDRRIEQLYAETRAAELQANQAFSSAAQRYCELGIELLKRRQDFRRGTWLDWLDERGIEQRYAQRAMQIAKRYAGKTDSLSDFSIEETLRSVQRRLPSVEGYTYEEVREVYDEFCPGAFKFHRAGEHPYSFEVSGYTCAFDTLEDAMGRVGQLRDKFARIQAYQSVDVPSETVKLPLPASEVTEIGESGWIKMNDGRVLNPQEYKVVEDAEVPESESDPEAVRRPPPPARSTRIENDYYPTPDAIIRALLERVTLDGQIIEPCAGHGAIADFFNGCISNEPYPTGDFVPDFECDATERSFWEAMKMQGGFDWVVTNPPYEAEILRPILENAFEFARVGVAFLLRLNQLEACADRKDWLNAHKDQMTHFISFSPRPQFRKDKSGGDMVTTGWMVWQKNWSWKAIGSHCPFDFVWDWKE